MCADDTTEPYRDGRVHVMSRKCSTCVFRPGNLMRLRPGRLKELTDHTQATGIPFSRHQTLPYAESDYVDHYGHDSTTMSLAYALDVVTEVPPYAPSDQK